MADAGIEADRRKIAESKRAALASSGEYGEAFTLYTIGVLSA